MDYMDPDVLCPKKTVKLNHSLTFKRSENQSSFFQLQLV